ncbi:dioxygenase [Enemella dayhoffiae]|uniref:Dioxygenase n=1 Tax=Enemella dayhoffiae TaxID=2016507 RepID=A0A255GUX1_9ACTN|nr:class III extradiol ring-cleavage dioxygenase [Enemella dayhoffiae]OYO19430.1 dioxygenase [Enemella dayhoffiae]
MTQPVLFLSHGAPPLADDPTWPAELARWSAGLERPEQILMVSAHWEQAPITVSATQRPVELTYDFWGFPKRYYDVRYDAPLAPGLADRVTGLLGEGVRRDEQRGLDHGAYVPLVEMYPDADVPVLQLSLPTLAPTELYALGERLAPLREEGTLIIGSGFTTHNLAWFNPGAPADAPAPTPSVEFDQWAAETVAAGDVDALLDFQHRAPAARAAHPRTEHWAPLYVALGAAAAGGSTQNRSTVDGFWFGLSKRSWQFG